MWKKEKEKNSVSQPHLQHAISQPMKLSCGDTFLFRGIELKSEMHELLSANTVKLKTREQLLTMAQEEQSEAARQNAGGKEEMDRSKQASPCVIEILDSTTECEEEAKPDRLQKEEKAFVSSLHSFMKDKGTPIERIPHLGFKQINLWRIYKAVDKLGGYDSVTARRLWKKVYDELGGSPGSTSAATCTRRHYERLVLPFERHVKGEEDKPLPPSKPRKPYKRNPESKMNKADGKRKRTLSERELDSEMCAQRSPEAACQREVMMSPHFALWAAAPEGCHSDCRQSNRPSTEFSPSANDHMLQVPISHSWVSHIPSATGEVISPLEKKKRMAQASLLAPMSSPREDKERPSVIHCSLSPARASSSRNSSDGSPFPLSSSSSRSSSPLSVSSEDSPSIKGSERPQSSSSPAKKPQEDKPVSCSQASTVPTGQSKEVSQVSAQTLTTNSAKSLKKDSAWKPYQKGTGKYFTYPLYTPSTFATSTSSFTKVAPKPVQLLRPAPLRPTYKIHQSRLYQQDDSLACAKKLNSVAPWPYQTEKRERSRTLPQKVPLPQQTLSQSGTHLPTSCILSSYDKSGRDSRHQPALHPAFFPHRMRLPQSQLIYRNVPIGPGHSAVVGPAIYPYTYTFPLLNPQAGYTLPTMNPIYPHKL